MNKWSVCKLFHIFKKVKAFHKNLVYKRHVHGISDSEMDSYHTFTEEGVHYNNIITNNLYHKIIYLTLNIPYKIPDVISLERKVIQYDLLVSPTTSQISHTTFRNIDRQQLLFHLFRIIVRITSAPIPSRWGMMSERPQRAKIVKLVHRRCSRLHTILITRCRLGSIRCRVPSWKSSTAH